VKSLFTFATLACAVALSGVRATCALPAIIGAPAFPTPTNSWQTAGEDRGASDTTSGVWLMTWTNKEQQVRHATLQLQQNGGAVSGTAKLEGGPARGSYPLTGTLQGNQISFMVKVYGRHVSFSGTVDGKKMSGTTKEGAPWLAAEQ
jgi:hypothetical protein